MKTQNGKLNSIIENFLMEKPKKKNFGNYKIIENELIYKTSTKITKNFPQSEHNDIEKFLKDKILISPSLEEIEKFKNENRYFKICAREINTDVIAKKIKKNDKIYFLGNANILPYVERTFEYGNEIKNNDETCIQKIMSNDQNFIMVPFSIFHEAKLNIENFQLIEKGKEENFKINTKMNSYPEEWELKSRHFTGAKLFSVDGNFYLFDVDRIEIKNNIFNPFLAKLPKKVESIKDAYQVLKPKEVVLAEKNKIEVLRQGEWFFIKTKKPKFPKISDKQKCIAMANIFPIWRNVVNIFGLNEKTVTKLGPKILEKIPHKQNLQAGNSRPNEVDLIFKQNKNIFCTGTVSHTGREHKDLKLNGWYLAYPNTSVKNFTITGNID